MVRLGTTQPHSSIPPKSDALRAAGKEKANDLAAKYKVCGHTGISVRVTMWGKRLSQGLRKAVTLSSFYIVTYNIRGHHILKFHPIYFLVSSLFLPAYRSLPHDTPPTSSPSLTV